MEGSNITTAVPTAAPTQPLHILTHIGERELRRRVALIGICFCSAVLVVFTVYRHAKAYLMKQRLRDVAADEGLGESLYTIHQEDDGEEEEEVSSIALVPLRTESIDTSRVVNASGPTSTI